MKKKILFSLLVIALAVVIGLISSIVAFASRADQNCYATGTIEFCYDGASDGLDPDGNVFNPLTLLSDEMISTALKNANLQDKYAVSVVSSCLYMEGTTPANVISQIKSFSSLVTGDDTSRTVTKNSYYPTKYELKLYTNTSVKIDKKDAVAILQGVVDAYKTEFIKTYTKALDFSAYDTLLTNSDNDYLFQLEVLETKIGIINSYASELYAKHADFVSSNGVSFNDITLQGNTLINNEIKKAKQSIVLNALSTDSSALKSYYEYQIVNLNYEKAEYTKDLATVSTTLAGYTKDSTLYISAGESVIKVDSNSSKTYDELLTKQIDISTKIAKINTEIADYQGKIDDIENSTAGSTEISKLNNTLTDINNQYSQIETSFKTLLNEYSQDTVLDNKVLTSKVVYANNSIISGAFIIQCIKSCGPLVSLALLGDAIFFLVLSVKKNKKEQAQ